MKKLIIPIIFLLCLGLVSAESTCIYFFYGDGCPNCEFIEPTINQLEEEYSLEVHRFEIYGNEENRKLLGNYFNNFEVSGPKGVPAVFISNEYLIGSKEINDNLENLIKNDISFKCPELIQIEKLSFFEYAGVFIIRLFLYPIDFGAVLFNLIL
jgi:thiol-disulfide isomerase/thioredoxin